MSADWPLVELPEVVEILDRYRVPVSAKERAERPGSVPYFGATGQAGWIDEALFDEPLVLLGEDAVPFLDPTAPKAYLVDGPSWVNNHAHVLRPDPDKIDRRFLVYALNAATYRGLVNGTTRLKLTQGAMRKLAISLPSVDEQRQIVERLDALLRIADDALSGLERADVLAKAFYRSQSRTLLGFDNPNVARVQLADLSRTVSVPVKIKQADYQPSGSIPVIDQGEGFIAGYTDDISAALTEPPYVLFGDHTRRVKLVDFNFAQGADGLKVLSPLHDTDARWLAAVLDNSLPPSRGYGRHFGLLREVTLPRPPSAEQAAVANQLADVKAQVDEWAAQSERIRRMGTALRTALVRDAMGASK